MKRITLARNREHTILRRHPWIFSGAVASAEGDLASGETVQVVASDGTVLGLGAWSPGSQIRVRMWDFDPAAAAIDAAFFQRRLAQALAARAALRLDGDAQRLVNAESDGLPGLIVDRYGEYLVCQFTAAGVEQWKPVIVELLASMSPCAGVYERSDADVRSREGLAPTTGVLAGHEPPPRIAIREGACRFQVDVLQGHKTGFYLDQRVNRATVAAQAAGTDVLNAFAYTGGFGVAAGVAGAKSVVHVDLSAAALELARVNTALNGLDAVPTEFMEGNVFDVLRRFRDARRTFDLIVLDPPKFVDAKAHVMAACRGYKDINLLGLKLLRPGGVLATFSCSGLVSRELFHKVVADAAVDAHRDVQILAHLGQAPDHPEGVCFEEGLYLKGLLCRVS